MVKRISRKATISHTVSSDEGVVTIAVDVTTQGAHFRSADATRHKATDEWILESTKLSLKLNSYESVRRQVDERCQASRQRVPTAYVPSNARQLTPDEWMETHYKHIADRLRELDYYRRNAGVTSSPPGFFEQVKRDIDGPYGQLLEVIAQVRQTIEERSQDLCRQMVTDDVIAKITAEPVKLTRLDKGTEYEYVLYRGVVWQADRELRSDQWRILIDDYLSREKAALAQTLGLNEIRQGRERIAPEVRRAVWTRDKGCCVRCGSRDRLEYDHIIPLSRGGSNTERNVELLCETCNRAKSDQIS